MQQTSRRQRPLPFSENLSRALDEHFKTSSLVIDLMHGDGSTRKYYRVSEPATSQKAVLMRVDVGPQSSFEAETRDWLELSRFLHKHRLRTPQVFDSLEGESSLLIEDCGDLTLEKVVCHKNTQISSLAPSLYEAALTTVSRFISLPQNKEASWCQRAFDTEKFVAELTLFEREVLQGVLKNPKETAQFKKEVQRLGSFLSKQPQYFVHRDFHSRNLMIKNGELVIIDFQDARLGPAAYDIVSLVFDSYVPFKAEQRRDLLTKSLNILKETTDKTCFQSFESTWRPTLLQRQLKAIGSFAWLSRLKRGPYLKYIPAALETLTEFNLVDSRWPFLSQTLPARLLESKRTC